MIAAGEIWRGCYHKNISLSPYWWCHTATVRYNTHKKMSRYVLHTIMVFGARVWLAYCEQTEDVRVEGQW